MSGRDERPNDPWDVPYEDRVHYADILSYGLDDRQKTENPDEVTCPLCLTIMGEMERKENGRK